jgi:dolichol kinase
VNTAIITCIIVVCLAAAELVARHTKLPAPLLRKLVHTSTAVIVCITAVYFDYKNYIYVGSLFTILLLLARRWHPLDSLRDRSEKSFGDILFPLGIAATALIAPNANTFIGAILILGFADTMAYYIGRNMPSVKLFFNKTLAGSLGFVLCASLVAALFLPLPFAVITAVACGLTELASPSGSDNFTVPLVACVMFVFLH